MNADLDFLGMVNLLKGLRDRGIISQVEQEKIISRLRIQTGSKIIVFL